MRWKVAACLLILPGFAFAQNHLEYYPTTQDIYLSCKEAISLADDGDIQGFYNSSCGTRIEGILAGIRYATISSFPYAIDKNDPEGKLLLPKSYMQRFCFLKVLAKPYPEIDLAKRYVVSLEHIESTQKKYMQGRQNPDITSIFNDICNAELEAESK